MIGAYLLILLAEAPALPAAPPAATPAALPEVPPVTPLTCETPRVPERLFVAQDDIAYLTGKAAAYGQCINRYLEERNRRIQALQAQIKAEVDAANAAIHAAEEVKARVEAVRRKNMPEAGQ